MKPARNLDAAALESPSPLVGEGLGRGGAAKGGDSCSTPAAEPVAQNTLEALHDWPTALLAELDHEPVVMRCLIAGLRGSAPREPGASLLLSGTRVIGTIGGGALEWAVLDDARRRRADGPLASLRRHILGIELGQCCGGVVEVLTERWTRDDRPLLTRIAGARAQGAAITLRTQLSDSDGTPPSRELAADAPSPRIAVEVCSGGPRVDEPLAPDAPPVWLIGAGHVGRALAGMLAELPFATTWIDARAELFPPPADQPTPGRVEQRPGDALAMLDSAPAGTRFVVMTHDHALDYALVSKMLARGDAAFIGLIGSDSKAARFRARFARDGFSPAEVASVHCPIGIDGIKHKWPGAIAVSVAAQLLQSLSAAPVAKPLAAGEDCSEAQCRSCPR